MNFFLLGGYFCFFLGDNKLFHLCYEASEQALYDTLVAVVVGRRRGDGQCNMQMKQPSSKIELISVL
jgi:hypothetical protein